MTPSGAWDVLVVGAGPAGLSCAAYCARAGRTTLVLDPREPGGKARWLERIETYPGFPGGVSGRALAERLVRQARRWGARLVRVEVTRVRRNPRAFLVEAGRRRFAARAVCVATGTEFVDLGVPGEDRLKGAGVHHAAFGLAGRYRGAEVAVVGGGETALHQALSLADSANRVRLVFRGRRLKANGRLLDRLAAVRSRLELYPQTRPLAIMGDGRVSGLKVAGPGGRRELPASAVFVLAGQKPRLPALDGLARAPGLFIAGDARGWRYRQAACAAADGIAAAMACESFLTFGSLPGPLP